MADAKKPAGKPAGGAGGKKSPASGRWTMFEKKGDAFVAKRKYCPKCGEGFFLSEHQNRKYCGKCHYTEFASKK